MAPILDHENRLVRNEESSVKLTPKEYEILNYLLKNNDRIVSAEEIYQKTWHEEPFDVRMIISVHIRHLREKLEKNPSNPKIIKSYWKKGYRLIV